MAVALGKYFGIPGLLSLVLLTQLQAQLNAKLEELKSNVVYIEAVPKENNAELKDGFGFITGEQGGLIYIVTAAHTFDFSNLDLSLKEINISVQFFQSAARLPAQVKIFPNDLALLSVNANAMVKWKKDCADFSPKVDQVVSVIGAKKAWMSPGQGRITLMRTSDFITFTNNADGIIRGTSGAPLINEKGIIGMVMETEGSGGISEALSLTRIRDLLNEYPANFALKPDGAGLVYIAKGVFDMGSSQADPDARPIHSVELSHFYIMPHEVSFEEYDDYCIKTMQEGKRPKDKGWGRGKKPAINVSWFDAIDYCNWLSERTLLENVYSIGKDGEVIADFSKNGYRLPTEAEWEYAAQGGAQKRKPIYGNGKDELSGRGINYAGLSLKQTWNVDEGETNAYGLRNMSGNVAEWCWDNYGFDYYKNSKPQNPTGPIQIKNRVVRGGAFDSQSKVLRVFAREKKLGRFPYPNIGFRMARNAE
ncbi:SUMF1/EgtB/PvdO family nonheme iron enzyme [Haliscomenobacter hydrossis]|uniref:Sulphatase-modifying factor protein n=1 Tax=Haliscomenobacter hydrossis (strain ATCC 27775 / DSM 1100 / LMG 10767 / O) TaxID=760192 RepID=F4KQB2_HALH1|nr:SUMF1/EgtB/PvdO family nonheme iron enzyme [Haliscomenobacter hydrossis]AEE48938.1 Sulphatase-modifying factor protein [Haliscomenobacter hydrossis DSM 1100]